MGLFKSIKRFAGTVKEGVGAQAKREVVHYLRKKDVYERAKKQAELEYAAQKAHADVFGHRVYDPKKNRMEHAKQKKVRKIRIRRKASPPRGVGHVLGGNPFNQPNLSGFGVRFK